VHYKSRLNFIEVRSLRTVGQQLRTRAWKISSRRERSQRRSRSRTTPNRRG